MTQATTSSKVTERVLLAENDQVCPSVTVKENIERNSVVPVDLERHEQVQEKIQAIQTSSNNIKGLRKIFLFFSGSLNSLIFSWISDNDFNTISQILLPRCFYYYYLIIAEYRFTCLSPDTLRKRNNMVNTDIVTNKKGQGNRKGPLLLWSFLSFYTCLFCFVRPDLVNKQFFNSLVIITGSSKRYGKNANLIIRLMSEISINLYFLPKVHSIENNLNKKLSSFQHIKLGLNSLPPLLQQPLDKLVKLGHFNSHIHHDKLLCAVQHPSTSSCLRNALETQRDVVLEIGGVYAIINLFSIFIGAIKKNFAKSKNTESENGNGWLSIKEARQVASKFVLDTFRSTLMVSTFVSFFSYLLCIFRVALKRQSPFMFGYAGLLAAPTIFLDKPGRLFQLNMYVFNQFLGSMGLLIADLTHVKLKRWMMAPLYGASTVLLGEYSEYLKGMTGKALKFALS